MKGFPARELSESTGEKFISTTFFGMPAWETGLLRVRRPSTSRHSNNTAWVRHEASKVSLHRRWKPGLPLWDARPPPNRARDLTRTLDSTCATGIPETSEALLRLANLPQETPTKAHSRGNH